jgi:hypothetical protein
MDLCCELPKLTNLVEHFQEHKKCNDNSFVIFLLTDYLNVDGEPKDHSDDSDHHNLPFNGNNNCCHISVLYSPDQHFEVGGVNFAVQNKFDFYSLFLTALFPDSLFQPPKA